MKAAGAPGLDPKARTFAPCFWLATWFGSGLSPIAPGTVGTLATLPLHFLLVLLPASLHFGLIVLLTVLGMGCADHMARRHNNKDPQIVVVDESAGVLLALFFVRDGGWVAFVAAALLFRGFDILKPWPISWLEKLRPAGLGIMADDLAAGLVAGGIVLAALHVWG